MNNEGTVERFTRVERVGHLLYAIAFVALAATGLTLYLPQLAVYGTGEAGTVTRFIHRLAAMLLVAAPLLYLILAPRRFLASAGLVLHWRRADGRWLGPGLRFYWTGSREGIPPQDKFNTGQKLHALIQAVCFAVFVATGLILWIWFQQVSAAAFRLSLILHDAAFVVSFGAFLVHLYLVLLHPLTRHEVTAMVDGGISASRARELYSRWYEEVRGSTQRR